MPDMATDTVVSHEEQRLVLRLMVHWRALARDRAMPAFADFNPAAVPDIWADSFLVDARKAPDLVFHALGPRHIEALGRDGSGQKVTMAGANTLLGHALSYAEKVIERRVPISLGGQFVDNEGRLRLYRSILLPLDYDGGLALLGAANCRIVVTD